MPCAFTRPSPPLLVQEFEEQLPPTEDDQPQQSEGSDPDAKPEPEDWWNTKPESGAAELADSLMDAFEKEWEPAMENLEAAQQVFGWWWWHLTRALPLP